MLIQLRKPLHYFKRRQSGGLSLQLQSDTIEKSQYLTLDLDDAFEGLFGGVTCEFQRIETDTGKEFFVRWEDLTADAIEILDDETRDHKKCICQPEVEELVVFKDVMFKKAGKKS